MWKRYFPHHDFLLEETLLEKKGILTLFGLLGLGASIRKRASLQGGSC